MVYRTASFFNDLERPLTTISRSRHYLTPNVSVTAKDSAIVAIKSETEPELSNGTSFNDLEE